MRVAHMYSPFPITVLWCITVILLLEDAFQSQAPLTIIIMAHPLLRLHPPFATKRMGAVVLALAPLARTW